MANFSLTAVFGANISGFIAGMNSAQDKAKSAAATIGSNLKSHVGGMLAGIVGIGAIEETIRKTIEFGGHVTDLSLKLGLSTDEVQEWDYALSLSGSSIDNASSAFTRLGISMAKAKEGDREAIEHFKTLGVTVDDLRGKSANPIMIQIARKFKDEGPNGDYLEGALAGVAGKSAVGALAGAFRDGADEMVDKFREGAMGITAETIASLDELGDKWTTFTQRIRANAAPAVGFGAELASKALDIWEEVGAVSRSVAVGVVAGVKSMSVNDLGMDPISAAARGYKAASEEYKDLVTGLDANRKEESAATVEQKAAKKGRDPALIAKQEMDRKAIADAKATENARKQLDAEARKGELAKLTDYRKIEFLNKEMELLKKKIDLETDPVKKVELQTDLQKDKNEIADLRKKGVKSADSVGKTSIPDMQKIGGFLGAYTQAPEAQALEIHKKNERHLGVLRKYFEGKQVGEWRSGTEF